jgi:hypothetical protein
MDKKYFPSMKTEYLLFMARKNVLRDSPAGEPRQNMKVCDLLNSGSASASLSWPHGHILWS